MLGNVTTATTTPPAKALEVSIYADDMGAAHQDSVIYTLPIWSISVRASGYGPQDGQYGMGYVLAHRGYVWRIYSRTSK